MESFNTDKNLSLQEVGVELSILNRLIGSGPVVLFEWSGDEGWPIVHVSHNVENILGISHERLLNSSVKFADFIHLDDIERVIYEVGTYIATQTPSFAQNYRLTTSAGILWVKDFTVIEYHPDGTPQSIYGYLFDNTTEVEAQLEIQRLSFTDRLTALPNRHKMQFDMNAGHPYGCVVFNIDRFRETNDFFGIAVGDSILVQLADWFGDIGLNAYRIGGDEFAILLYEPTSWETLERTLLEWLDQLTQAHFGVGNESIAIRINIGVALGGEKLLTQADIALHRAKDIKQPYALYEKEENIEDQYRNNIAMTATVHKALFEGRIICHYQPIIDFSTGETVKYETLVRLIDENGMIISPLFFLPIAKKTKLYSHITRTVVHQACELFSNRKEEFSINLTVDDIQDPVTVQEIITTLLKTHTASRVVFEILESEGIENYDSVENFITQVKSLGAKIAIDDFGSGYSNFEHILKLNIDYIKIDGSLVRNIFGNNRHRIIIETIVQFARKIGAKTIAEFVSDKDIFDILKTLNVDYSQGYYTGKPEALT